MAPGLLSLTNWDHYCLSFIITYYAFAFFNVEYNVTIYFMINQIYFYLYNNILEEAIEIIEISDRLIIKNTNPPFF